MGTTGAPVERTLHRVFRIDPTRREGKRDALGPLASNGVAFVCLYAWFRLQSDAGRGPSPVAAPAFPDAGFHTG